MSSFSHEVGCEILQIAIAKCYEADRLHPGCVEAAGRLSESTATRIRSKIEQYAEDPASLAGNVRKLQRREGYRLRVGDYRVIFDDDGSVLDILAVGPRSSIYD